MTDELLQKVVDVWAPNYPRRCSGLVSNHWRQVSVNNSSDLISNIKKVEGNHPCYISTYSFPDGHTTEGGVPKIDCLMIDFDFEFDKNEFDIEVWEDQLSELLERIRRLCNSLIERGYDKHWRASLSGFKGVHLYLDFLPLGTNFATKQQYHNGMHSFTDNVISSIIDDTGIEDLQEYIDVSSGWDLPRLTRLPNTIHEKATKQFDEERYCVPVTIEELSKINVRTYTALTKAARELPDDYGRVPNVRTNNLIEKYIITSPKVNNKQYSSSVKSTKRYRDYVDNKSNEKVTLDHVEFLLNRKPCVWAFHENPDKFNHGNASHIMEIQCIIAMSSIGTPVEVMKKFFKEHPIEEQDPSYDEQSTERRIKEILSRDYGEFNCSSILEDAPQFCLKSGCKIYRDDSRLQNI